MALLTNTCKTNIMFPKGPRLTFALLLIITFNLVTWSPADARKKGELPLSQREENIVMKDLKKLSTVSEVCVDTMYACRKQAHIGDFVNATKACASMACSGQELELFTLYANKAPEAFRRLDRAKKLLKEMARADFGCFSGITACSVPFLDIWYGTDSLGSAETRVVAMKTCLTEIHICSDWGIAKMSDLVLM